VNKEVRRCTEPNAGWCATNPALIIRSTSTETGGLMLFVQYQGPTTGGRPVYDGRFNMTARRPLGEENVER
jgi:hypothetical protein